MLLLFVSNTSIEITLESCNGWHEDSFRLELVMLIWLGCYLVISTHSWLCYLHSMSLYPSLEDLKVDKVIKVRVLKWIYIKCGAGFVSNRSCKIYKYVPNVVFIFKMRSLTDVVEPLWKLTLVTIASKAVNGTFLEVI